MILLAAIFYKKLNIQNHFFSEMKIFLKYPEEMQKVIRSGL